MFNIRIKIVQYMQLFLDYAIHKSHRNAALHPWLISEYIITAFDQIT